MHSVTPKNRSRTKMPLVQLYFAPVLLLLVLSCPQVSRAGPVRVKGPVSDGCVQHAHTLLRNVTHTLTQDKLFSSIDCPKQSVELNMETDTPNVCAPKDSTCSGVVKSDFDQESCLTNIGEDLRHYYTFLAAQPDPEGIIASTVLLSLRELMENCFIWSLPKDLEVAAEDSSFGQRLRLCKVLQGFQLRCTTISRALSYISSEQHTTPPTQ